MYLLLETLTFPEALGVEGLRIWGEKLAGTLNVEGQRFWFLALVCGAGAGVLKALRLAREGGGAGVQNRGKSEGEKEQARRIQSYRVRRRLVADIVDLSVPGAVVGWIPVSPGTVGLLMLVSTWLTGLEVWDRCAPMAAPKLLGKGVDERDKTTERKQESK